MSATMYKVLRDGRSCNGGEHEWSLPTKNGDGEWTPGDWHEHDGKLAMCHSGFHITSDPPQWWDTGRDVFEVEHDGYVVEDGGDKICVSRVRLVRQVEDLSEVRIYGPGRHVHKGGRGLALAGSSVEARDNSSVVARGNSSVVAWDNSSVEAWDNSSVVARGNSSVVAWDNSSVVAWDNSSVVAWDNSSVVAWDNSSVEARDNSSVEARDNSSVEARGNSLTRTPANHAWGEPTVKVEGHAIYIDQRGGRKVYAVTQPEFAKAEGSAS